MCKRAAFSWSVRFQGQYVATIVGIRTRAKLEEGFEELSTRFQCNNRAHVLVHTKYFLRLSKHSSTPPRRRNVSDTFVPVLTSRTCLQQWLKINEGHSCPRSHSNMILSEQKFSRAASNSSWAKARQGAPSGLEPNLKNARTCNLRLEVHSVTRRVPYMLFFFPRTSTW